MVYIRKWSDAWNPVKKDTLKSPTINDDAVSRPITPPETSTPEDTENLPAVSVYFSPGKDPEQNIIGFITRTKETLDIAAFAFTSRDILKALKLAISRGVKVRILFDKGQAGMPTSVYSLVAPLLGNDALLDKSDYQQHNKLAISDNKAVITGSYNWSTRALNNYENLVILRDQESITKFSSYFEEIWSKNL